MESPEHATLAATLRQLRIDAGLSQTAAAAASGLTQAKISRLERHAYTPDPDDVRNLARAYRAPAKVRRELERTAKDLAESRVYSRIILQRGAWKIQQQTHRIENASARIRSFHPTLVPGLLQTRAYAAAMFASAGVSGDSLDRTVQERLNRQANLTSGRDFGIILTEGALRWQATDPGLMVDQIDHIIDTTRLPNVRVGVVPYTQPTDFFVQEGFDLYDTAAVIIGTTTATATINNNADVMAYDKLFGLLESVAAYDDACRSVLARIADDYRDLAG